MGSWLPPGLQLRAADLVAQPLTPVAAAAAAAAAGGAAVRLDWPDTPRRPTNVVEECLAGRWGLLSVLFAMAETA